jgi:hypothetical protein
VDHSVQQRLHTLVAVGGAAGHRHQAEGAGALADAGPDLLLGQFLPVQVLGHELVVLLGGGLEQLFAVFGHALPQLGGDVHDLAARAQIVGVEDRFARHQVDDAAKAILGADRQLDGDGVGGQPLPHLLQDAEKIGADHVHLVDERDARHPVAVRLAPDGLRLGLHALLGGEDGDDAIQDTQRALHLDGEVHVSRSVDDVDAMVLPETRGRRRGDGDTPLLLLHHPVHRGGALVHLSHAVHLAGVKQDAFGRRGLAGVDMGSNPDISQARELGRTVGHRVSPPRRALGPGRHSLLDRRSYQR